jgi:cephalosporin hydroxylase
MSQHDPKDPEQIRKMGEDAEMAEHTRNWFNASCGHNYSYNFKWMGRPIIQFPQDIVATQEIIWDTKPDLIIETGIAHGGSLILSASMLELLGNDGQVLGVDIEIRPHNRTAIEEHPMFKRISMIEGSSVDDSIADQVRKHAEGKERIMLILDSNHTHEHVLQELEFYSSLVTKGCYLIVFDTVVEDMPADFFPNRPWGPGDNPKTAVREFLKSNSRFELDREIQDKLQITVAPDGYLKCIAD